MFTNDSTENLLDNLESELSEVIDLEPKKFVTLLETKVEIETERQPPVPAKRNLNQEALVNPTKRVQSLDKKEKNDENEIIQLSSMSSSSENLKNISPNTVLVAKGKVLGKVVQAEINEAFEMNETPSIASKSSLNGHDEEIKPLSKKVVEVEANHKGSSTSTDRKLLREPKVEIVSEKAKTAKVYRETSFSASESTTSSRTTAEKSSDSTSELEESVKQSKKSKTKSKDKKKKKSKSSTDDIATSSEPQTKPDKSRPESSIGKMN